MSAAVSTLELLQSRLPSPPGSGIFTACISSCNTYILHGGASRTLHLTKLPNLHPTSSLHGHAHQIQSCATTSTRHLSAGGDRSLFLWDAATSTLIARLAGRNGHHARINAVAFAAPNQQIFLSGSYDRSVRIWDARARDGKPVQVLSDAKDAVTSLCVSASEIYAASVDGFVRTYDVRKGELREDALGVSVASLAVTRDGNCLLAACLDNKLRLLDKASGELLQLYEGHVNQHFQIDCAVSHDDGLLFYGDERGGFCAWDLTDGSQPAWRGGAHGKDDVAAAVQACENRPWVVSGTHKGHLSLWKIENG